MCVYLCVCEGVCVRVGVGVGGVRGGGVNDRYASPAPFVYVPLSIQKWSKFYENAPNMVYEYKNGDLRVYYAITVKRNRV